MKKAAGIAVILGALITAPLAMASQGGAPAIPCYDQGGDMIHTSLTFPQCEALGGTQDARR